MGATAAQPMAGLKEQRHAAKWLAARCILALILLHVAHAWRFTSLPPEYEHLLANTDEEAATGATRALLQNPDIAAAAIGPRGEEAFPQDYPWPGTYRFTITPTPAPGPIPSPATRSSSSSNKRKAVPAAAQALLASLPAVAGQPVTATNVYGRTCSVDQILMPSSTQELAAALQQLHASNYNYTIRTTHSAFHSINSLVCSADESGSGSGQQRIRIIVLLDKLTSVLSVDQGSRQLSVQAGMSMAGLLAAANSARLSMPLLTLPDYVGLTVGGVLATAATGTGLGTTAGLVDIVVSLTWVNAKGEVRTSSRYSREGRALVGGVGLLGVITEVTLQLEPWTLVRVDTPAFRRPDWTLAEDIQNILKVQKQPHLTVIWRPDLQEYTSFVYTRVASSTPVNGTLNDTPLSDLEATLLRGQLQQWQNDVAGNNALTNGLMCDVIVPMSSTGKLWAKGLGGRGEGATVAIAPANNLMVGGCADKPCPWDAAGANFMIDEAHSAIELQQLAAWIEDVRALVEQDLKRGGKAPEACMPPGFFWLRFGNASQDTVSWTGGLREPVHIQLSLFTSRGARAAGRPMRHTYFMEAVEQLNLCKYRAKPHWGKNFDRTFTHPRCTLSSLYRTTTSTGGFPALRRLQAQHDPKGAFVSPLLRRVLAGTAPPRTAGCALRGECYCSADSHCARDYSCVSSEAFPQYKVCKPSSWLSG